MAGGWEGGKQRGEAIGILGKEEIVGKGILEKITPPDMFADPLLVIIDRRPQNMEEFPLSGFY